MGPAPNTPYFKGPRKYVKILEEASGPLFSRHNHDPAIAKCKNGDLLAIWYTCFREPGRELALAASRLRYEAEEWDDADLFWMRLTVMTMLQRSGSTVKKPCITSMGFRPDQVTKEED